jgi:hypothetical protein
VLAELALYDGELLAQQKDLGVLPCRIAAGKPRRFEQSAGEEEDEAEAHENRSSPVRDRGCKRTTSMDGTVGTLRPAAASAARTDSAASAGGPPTASRSRRDRPGTATAMAAPRKTCAPGRRAQVVITQVRLCPPATSCPFRGTGQEGRVGGQAAGTPAAAAMSLWNRLWM